jgi:hypothetical protein
MSGPLEYVATNLSGIMTGLTMGVIAVGVYETRDGFFLAGTQFRGKYSALVIWLASLSAVSLTTPLINQFWESALPYIPPGQIAGIILIMAMVSVNRAAEWNLFDPKSVVAYAVGIILIYRPSLIYGI